jgi:hypothetical protein
MTIRTIVGSLSERAGVTAERAGGGQLNTADAERFRDPRTGTIQSAASTAADNRSRGRRPARAFPLEQPRQTGRKSADRGTGMATYRMVYGENEPVVTETFDNIDEVEREDGWLTLFRGNDAILRVQESHVHSIERLDASSTTG